MVSRDSLPEGLLSDVKNYLNITWDDDATDKKVSGLIASGMIYLNAKYGKDADYTADGMPRTLLMEYVRYARDSALDVFENNYQALLLGMHPQSVTVPFFSLFVLTRISRPQSQRHLHTLYFCSVLSVFSRTVRCPKRCPVRSFLYACFLICPFFFSFSSSSV